MRIRRASSALVALALLLGQSATVAAVAMPRCANLHTADTSSRAAGAATDLLLQTEAETQPAHLPHDHGPSDPAASGSSFCTVVALVASQDGNMSIPGESTVGDLLKSTTLPTGPSASPPYRPPRV